MSEKDFCTLLTEQIIDERNATKAYRRLLDYFEEEKPLLQDRLDRMWAAHEVPDDIENIAKDESKHEKLLEYLRQNLCAEVKRE